MLPPCKHPVNSCSDGIMREPWEEKSMMTGGTLTLSQCFKKETDFIMDRKSIYMGWWLNSSIQSLPLLIYQLWLNEGIIPGVTILKNHYDLG